MDRYLGLTDLESDVYARLSERHHGRAQAVQAGALADDFGVPERELRRTIRSLRMQGARIASTASQPAGYYIPETVEEAEAYKREQYAKALATLQSTAAVLRVSVPELVGQLSFDLAKVASA